jgi:uncharacterized protein YegJ (DUF2314 family)
MHSLEVFDSIGRGPAMRNLIAIVAIVVPALSATIPGAVAQKYEIVDVGENDRTVNSAIAQARRTLPRFERAFRERSAETYSVKVAIPDERGGEEYIWMQIDRIEGGIFHGRIANHPRSLPSLSFGSNYSARKTQISDWTFTRGGLAYGNYTTRMLLDRMPPARAAEIKSTLSPKP